MSLVNLLFAIAIFLGSFLLFLVEPLAAKRLLPLLGGSAAVWTTCLVFFQTTLLLGYLCAHLLATRLPQRTQVLVYSGLLAACLGQASMNLHPDLPVTVAHPVVRVFTLLGSLIGLPFLALSATNPLLQAWYARGAASAKAVAASVNASQSGKAVIVSVNASQPVSAPYRLFALSNLGSLLALITYPWLVEPRWSLRVQSLIWLAGFAVFALACAGIAWLKFRSEASLAVAPAVVVKSLEIRVAAGDRVMWLALAACGSVLLCAMTNHVTQNIAAIPLLWIVPLTMYLLSFVVAFSRGGWLPPIFRVRIPVLEVTIARLCLLVLTAVSLISIGYMLADTSRELPLKFLVPFYCAALFITCLFCHAELHRLRPAPDQATSFYLMIAAGGALGSIFVGIFAPVIFSGSYELGCALVFTAGMMLAVTASQGIGWRVIGCALTVGMVVFFYLPIRNDRKNAIVQVRNFYGTLRVTQELQAPHTEYTRTLYHGTIIHGTQVFTSELRTTPTSYYARDSGVGLALDLCCDTRPRRVGIIGLGAGTLAAYGRKGDVFRFYDINPLVEPIARNWFSYLRESAAAIEIVPGDARLSMETEEPQRYDVLVVDAFSGDAIPVHLITREALDVYQRHLVPGGIIAFHVSNQFLDLVPVVKQQADHGGLQARLVITSDDDDVAEFGADWVLVTANADFLSQTSLSEADSPIPAKTGLRLWTDDYNSVLPLLRWSKPPASDQSDQ
jgi:spermidine synthase